MSKHSMEKTNCFLYLNEELKKKKLLVFRKPQVKAVTNITIYNSAVICSNVTSEGLMLFGEVGKAFLESRAENSSLWGRWTKFRHVSGSICQFLE